MKIKPTDNKLYIILASGLITILMGLFGFVVNNIEILLVCVATLACLIVITAMLKDPEVDEMIPDGSEFRSLE